MNNANSLESQGFPAFFALFRCKVFLQICEKPLHLPVHMVRHVNRIRIDFCLNSIKTVKKGRFYGIGHLAVREQAAARLVQQTLYRICFLCASTICAPGEMPENPKEFSLFHKKFRWAKPDKGLGFTQTAVLIGQIVHKVAEYSPKRSKYAEMMNKNGNICIKH